MFTYSSSCFQSYRFHSFPKLLRSAFFIPIPFREVVSYICNTVVFFFYLLHSILGFFNLINYSFLISHIKVHVCATKFCEIWQIQSVTIAVPYKTKVHLCFTYSTLQKSYAFPYKLWNQLVDNIQKSLLTVQLRLCWIYKQNGKNWLLNNTKSSKPWICHIYSDTYTFDFFHHY